LAAALAPAPALLHGFELLLLLIVKNHLNLALAVLADGLHLRAAIFARERLVLEDRLHLLLAINENGLDLALLIGAKVELPGHVLKLFVGVHAHGTATLFPILRWRSVVLGKGESGPSGAKQQCAGKCEVEQSV